MLLVLNCLFFSLHQPGLGAHLGSVLGLSLLAGHLGLLPLPSSLHRLGFPRVFFLPPPLDLSILCPQAALQVGGHGERLTQCREVLLTTAKAIPVQVDGEPCKLAASRIRIALRNQATMVQKAKRRSAAPLHSE